MAPNAPNRSGRFDAREVLVDLARKGPRRGVVTEVHSGCAYRCHGDVDPGVVHERDHRLLGPLKRRQPSDRSMRIIGLSPEKVR